MSAFVGINVIQSLASDSAQFYYALLASGLSCDRAQALAQAFTTAQAAAVMAQPVPLCEPPGKEG